MTPYAINGVPPRGGALATFLLAGLLAPGPAPAADAKKPPTVEATVTLRDDAVSDQDDMCIWVHPREPSRSTIITSDKAAGKLFVYDLAGKTVQSIPAGRPGNIDLRYGFALAGRKVDVVAFNQRKGDEVWVFAVDAATRKLLRVDNGKIETRTNYGGTLFRSPKTSKLYFLSVCTTAEQIELLDDGSGKVAGKTVRQWKIGYSEGAVGDDEAGMLFIAEEDGGVWAIGGEPTDPTPGRRVARVGADGLRGDVEGLAIYHRPGGGGYLLVSNQSRDRFGVYGRRTPHRYLGSFAVRGARDTDGIDVTNVPLGRAFPRGLFACHSGVSGGCPVLLTPWDRIAGALPTALTIDTSWDPRKGK